MFAIFATLGDFGGGEPPAAEAEVASLVDAARGGDSRAAQRLYRMHAGRVFRAVRAWCPSEAEAEELTQDVFVRALSSLDRYEKREGARFVSWLLAIAVNLARQRARASSRTRAEDEETLERAAGADEAPDAGTAIDAERTKRALLAALAEIPERDREVVSLRYGAELSAAEVARATGLSEANVRKVCERRRTELAERIRKILGDTPGNEGRRTG